VESCHEVGELKSKDSTQQQRESTGLKYRTSTCVEEPDSISVGRIYGDAQGYNVIGFFGKSAKVGIESLPLRQFLQSQLLTPF
jgi:hypothetical protein